MASAGQKRKAFPDYVVYTLKCPVCLETIIDPPVYLCEKGHGMCQTCREPLKAQNKPCPVCRGKLTEARNLVVENMLEQLPKIKCKNEGCTFERSSGELVKTHEDVCRERPVKCEFCQEPVALSKLVGHLQTKHNRPPLEYHNLGVEEEGYKVGLEWNGSYPLTKVNNDLQFLFNWKDYDANAKMFWISLCGTQKEAKEYEYTIKIESSAEKKAGRVKFLLTGTGECLSCDLSHEDVKQKPTENRVMLFPRGILEKAAEGNDNKLQWRLVIKKSN